MIKKFQKPILVEPKLKVEAKEAKWGLWSEIALFFLGLIGYLLCNITAIGIAISPILMVLIGALLFGGMIFLVWYKRIFFGVLGGLVGVGLLLFPLTFKALKYLWNAVSVFLNYIIYLLGIQEGYSGYLEQLTIDMEPYLKNESLLQRNLILVLILLGLVAAIFYALALFKRIPVMLAYIVPIIGLAPFFIYGIVPHYLPFCLFLSSLIGCYGQSLVQQMSRLNERKAKKLEKRQFRKKKEPKKGVKKEMLSTEERFSFAAANGQFGIIIAAAILVVTVLTAVIVYSQPIIQMDAFRGKLDQVSTQVMNTVFRKTYEKQLNVAGNMGDSTNVGMVMPAWRGLEVAEVTAHTDQPIYLRYRTTAELTADGWQIPGEAMLENYNKAVDYDFYEYTQYYDFLCLTAPSGDPLAAALDNYYSEDEGYLTDQVTVYPKYESSNLLGIPAGCTTKIPISEYEEVEREGDTVLFSRDNPVDRSYSFRVVSPTLSSGVFLAQFDSMWGKYLDIRAEHGETDPYMVREQEYSNFVNAYYTQNPEQVKNTIGNLSWRITGEYPGRLAKVQAVERYLRDNYTYSATRKRVVRADGSPGDAYDYIEYFLNQNEEKSGYCTLFASSMVVLLRDIGIPARLVTGYYTQPTWTDVEYYTAQLTDSDYHAWVEVYFDGVGWLTFDPTPGFGEIRNDYLLDLVDEEKEPIYESEFEMEYVPNDKYVKYSNDLPEPSQPKEEIDISGTIMDALNLDQENIVLKTVIRVILWILLAVLILFLIHLFHRGQLRRALRGDPTAGGARAYEMVLRLMQMRGFKFFEGETVGEFARRADNLELAPVSMKKVVPIFEKVLYSDLALSEEERREAADYLFALDKALMRRVNPIKGLWYRLTLWVKPKHKGMIWHFK